MSANSGAGTGSTSAERQPGVGPEPASGVRWASIAAVVLGAVGCVCFVVDVARLFPFLVIDDAFITYRYAEHFAAGLGPTWNPGAPPVEGYSSPLYMALLALQKATFGFDTHAFSRWFCVASMAAALAATFVAARRLTRSNLWAAAALFALGVHPAVALWAIAGMEAAPYTALAAGLLVLTTIPGEAWGRRHTVSAIALLGCVVLIRTEGLAIAGAFVGARALVADRRDRTTLALGAASIGVFVVHLAVRRAYYGLWVPLPVHQKAEAWIGLETVWHFVRAQPLTLLLAAIGAATARRSGAVWAAGFGIASTGALLFVVAQADPVMAFFQRYTAVLLPALVVLAVLGLRWLVERAWYVAVGLALVAVLAQGADIAGEDRERVAEYAEWYSAALLSGPGNVALFLREHTDPTDTLVIADCGLVPYVTDMRVIDLFGLNDAHIAMGGDRPDYVFAQSPEAIVLTPMWVDGSLRRDPKLDAGYALAASFEGPYRYDVYLRRDIWTAPANGRSAE